MWDDFLFSSAKESLLPIRKPTYLAAGLMASSSLLLSKRVTSFSILLCKRVTSSSCFERVFFEVFEDARNSVENELSSVPSYIVIIASFKVRYRKFGPRKRYMPFDIGKIASFQMKYRQKKFRNRYLPFDIGVLASFQIGYRNF